MSEMTWTTIHIGGALPANLVDELRDRIDEDFSEVSDNGSIEDAIEEKRSHLVTGQVNYGNPDGVVAFCVDHGLAYWLHCDAGCEWEASIQIWAPGMDKAAECPAGAQTYEPMISFGQLRDDRDQGRSVEQIVERLGRFSSDKVPPITLGPDYHDAEPVELASSPATDMARG